MYFPAAEVLGTTYCLQKSLGSLAFSESSPQSRARRNASTNVKQLCLSSLYLSASHSGLWLTLRRTLSQISFHNSSNCSNSRHWSQSELESQLLHFLVMGSTPRIPSSLNSTTQPWELVTPMCKSLEL